MVIVYEEKNKLIIFFMKKAFACNGCCSKYSHEEEFYWQKQNLFLNLFSHECAGKLVFTQTYPAFDFIFMFLY